MLFTWKWQATKQRFSPTPSNITSFFGSIIPYGKDDPHPKKFEKDLLWFIIKKLMSLSFVESSFLRQLVLKQNPYVNFPSTH